MPVLNKPTAKLGLIVGNRGFFPGHLAAEGRADMLRVLSAAGVEVVALTPEESKYGAVEAFEEAKRLADLFRQHRDTIEGVIVTLPNFGDERAVADTLEGVDPDAGVIVHLEHDSGCLELGRAILNSVLGKIAFGSRRSPI